jgi:hypothetical protein
MDSEQGSKTMENDVVCVPPAIRPATQKRRKTHSRLAENAQLPFRLQSFENAPFKCATELQAFFLQHL